MAKWSEVIARLIPWLDIGEEDAEAACAEAVKVRREQQALAPHIAAQTQYLVTRGEVNGFTRQLRDGFRMKDVGE